MNGIIGWIEYRSKQILVGSRIKDQGSVGHYENALDFERKSLISAYVKADEGKATSTYQGRKTYETHENSK